MPVLEPKAAWLTACRGSRSQRLPAGPRPSPPPNPNARSSAATAVRRPAAASATPLEGTRRRAHKCRFARRWKSTAGSLDHAHNERAPALSRGVPFFDEQQRGGLTVPLPRSQRSTGSLSPGDRTPFVGPRRVRLVGTGRGKAAGGAVGSGGLGGAGRVVAGSGMRNRRRGAERRSGDGCGRARRDNPSGRRSRGCCARVRRALRARSPAARRRRTRRAPSSPALSVAWLVVVISPVRGQDLRLDQRGEHLDVEQLVTRREWKLSTYGFCHGEPGSMYAVPVRRSTHQSRSALAVSSGPLSAQVFGGAALGDQPLQRGGDGVGVDVAIDQDLERLAGELVDMLAASAPGHRRSGRTGSRTPRRDSGAGRAAARRARSSRRADGACVGGRHPQALPRATAAAPACGSPPSPRPQVRCARR